MVLQDEARQPTNLLGNIFAKMLDKVRTFGRNQPIRRFGESPADLLGGRIPEEISTTASKVKQTRELAGSRDLHQRSQALHHSGG